MYWYIILKLIDNAYILYSQLVINYIFIYKHILIGIVYDYIYIYNILVLEKGNKYLS